jgi:hypothetical protein
MKRLVVLVFVLCALHSYAQHPPKDNQQKKIPDRKNIGSGKPLLFTKATTKTIQAAAPLPKINTQQAFLKSTGDTLRFAHAGGDLIAVVLFKAKKNDFVTIMNLKVINYENAFMRLTRSTLNNKLKFRGLVHHPSYSDALVLRSAGGVDYFETTDQSKVVNE